LPKNCADRSIIYDFLTLNLGDKMMRNINSKNISDANASGRGLSSAPWNNYGNSFLTSKKVHNVKSEQNGRSMIEMLGVLAIIGVLSVGGIAGYSKAMHKYRMNKTIEQITLIAGNIRTFFAPQKSYEGIYCVGNSNGTSFSNHGYYNNGCPIIRKAKILPDEMITVNDAGEITNIVNPFGDGVNLETANNSALSDHQAFKIRYYLQDSDLEACIELASHDWTATGVKGIKVFDIGPGTGGYITVPGSLDKAVDLCSKTLGGSDYTEIRFFFDVSDNCWNETNGYTCLEAGEN